ncbi:uncharacterized protein BDW43DRAFT_293208 [Aspergillus alliaceus]|uniref:uncharacterized protein n=1 Tax=Petromyces alliaceus TaxID=209559 RepID=UPI0012A55C9C|nr:uncharacterized protein BDW43DRAFT_293208 [Aspergillus alliaceus]KAB8227718.1 hypothetical protein BDW43DRAFT_293208 [Aspergillus alliaceus]
MASPTFTQYEDKLPMAKDSIYLIIIPRPRLILSHVEAVESTGPSHSAARPPPSEKVSLAGGLTAIRGFFSTVRLAARSWSVRMLAMEHSSIVDL